jgi:hypothetical protein
MQGHIETPLKKHYLETMKHNNTNHIVYIYIYSVN